jgi:2-C-methyl-D-erythritol 4-phosphate cytidylyltransferase
MGGVKKELAFIEGVPVLKMVADAFSVSGVFDCVVITYPPRSAHSSGEDSSFRAVLDGVDLDLLWVAGGKTRQESVYNALRALSEHSVEYVLIHDAARPWVTDTLIQAVLRGTKTHGACIPVVPHINASKQVGDGGMILEHHERSTVVGAQTPQGFGFSDILNAHEEARKNGKEYPDDAEAYHHAIGSVYTVPGDPINRKITFEYDL